MQFISRLVFYKVDFKQEIDKLGYYPKSEPQTCALFSEKAKYLLSGFVIQYVFFTLDCFYFKWHMQTTLEIIVGSEFITMI